MMTTQAIQTSRPEAATAAKVRKVELSAPLDWLASGIRDFLAAPGSSLLYGALFSIAAGATLYFSWTLPGFTVAFLTGLLLIGPALAAGLYAGARQREKGEPVSIPAALSLLRSRASNLALFGTFLALVMVAWVRLSALVFALKFNSVTITLDGYLGILSGTGDPIAIAYFVTIGLVLAITVFVTSAVSVPMILDRDSGPLSAIRASVRAVSGNLPAMTLWALSIVVLTGIGVGTGFVAMVAIFPVLGYATWHSYRALIA